MHKLFNKTVGKAVLGVILAIVAMATVALLAVGLYVVSQPDVRNVVIDYAQGQYPNE